MINVQVSFLKSSEDHRLQLVKINQSIFAIVHSPLESNGPINLNCEDWSLVLLAPIKSEKNIVISAINVICLNQISSENGKVMINASNRLVRFHHPHHSSEKDFVITAHEKFFMQENVGEMLYYYRLFDGIVAGMRNGNLSSIPEAKQNFIGSLCTLADQVKKNQKNLTLPEVLSFWDIL